MTQLPENPVLRVLYGLFYYLVFAPIAALVDSPLGAFVLGVIGASVFWLLLLGRV